jgi:hypothetical protein
MRTTVRINDELLQRAKTRAHDQGRSLTSLIEEGLRVILAEPPAALREPLELPVSQARGGVLPGVDLNRASDLEEVMNNP